MTDSQGQTDREKEGYVSEQWTWTAVDTKKETDTDTNKVETDEDSQKDRKGENIITFTSA